MVQQIEWLSLFLAGYWNPNNKKFNNIGEQSNVWLAGGNNANFNQNKWNRNNNNRNYGFSGRLLKNWKISGSLRSAFIGLEKILDTDKLFYDLFQAYYDTRQHKRNTSSAVAFEMNYESKIIELRNDLVNGVYAISPSICFIIKYPVQREVFAADFRDRIIHHLIYNYIYELFDRHFIYDSYSCRVEKGTHFGIKRVEYFLHSCTQNYTRDAYILKLDIKGFFIHIDKQILFDQIKIKLSSLTKEVDHAVLRETEDLEKRNYNFIIKLLNQVIFHDPTKNCIIKGKKTDWDGLPDDKSLFHSPRDTGLAIGNLTSQLFANIYLDSLDKYIKYQIGFKYYGRYVDDFIIIDTDKQKLLSSIPQIKNFLNEKLHLTLHPKKIYFQHYAKGVQFLGAYIKPYRTYIRKRTIGNVYKRIQEINNSFKSLGPILSDHSLYKRETNLVLLDKRAGSRNITWDSGFKDNIQSIVNSYLGILNHYKTYKIIKKLTKNFNNRFWLQFHFTKHYTKVIPNIRKLKSSEIKNLYPQGYYNGNLR